MDSGQDDEMKILSVDGNGEGDLEIEAGQVLSQEKDDSPEWMALTNPVILSRILEHFKGEAKRFRLVHPLWNEAVLSQKPRLEMTLSLPDTFIRELPGLLKLLSKADQRLGRAIVVDDDCGEGNGTAALASLVSLGFDGIVQDLNLEFGAESGFQGLVLLAGLFEEYPFPQLRSLDINQHYVNHNSQADDDANAENNSQILRPLLSSLSFCLEWSSYADQIPKMLKGLVQRILNSAPNLEELTLYSNVSSSFATNLRLRKVDVKVYFGCGGNGSEDHDDDDEDVADLEHYPSATCYGDILRKLGVLMGCLESLTFRCLNVGSTCTICRSMIKPIVFPRFDKLKTLELYNPSYFFIQGYRNDLAALSKSLPRLQTLTLSGRTQGHLKDIQPVLKKWIKSLLLNPLTRGMDLRILSVDPATLLNISPVQNLKPDVILDTPTRTNKLAIKFIDFHSDNGNLVTQVLDSLATLPLGQLSIGLKAGAQGKFKLSTLIKAFHKSRIFDSQYLNIMIVGDLDSSYIRREDLRMFEEVVERVQHMRDVTFVKFSMPVNEAVLLGMKIQRDNLPVRFLSDCEPLSRNVFQQYH